MSKSPSLRRIQADIRELAIDPSDRYHAAPLEDDMFEWHFTIRGADGTEFEGGVYHGRILLPAEYPFKPPNVVFLTPSGRFETGTKVCLSFSAFHPELWQPAWGIRLILEALISFLPTPADGAIGALDWTKEERKRLAKKSLEYCCPRCGNAAQLLPKLEGKGKASSLKFQKEIEKLHALQVSNEANNKQKKGENGDAPSSDAPAMEEENPSSSAGHTDDQEDKAENREAFTKPNEPSLAGEEEDKQCSEESKQHQSDDTVEETNIDPNIANGLRQRVADQNEPDVNVANQTTAQQRVMNDNLAAEASVSPWLNDPCVHGIIICFCILVALLYRKFQALLAELRELEF